MVTSPNVKQNDDLERRAQNTFQIGLITTIVMTIVIIGTGLMQLWSGESYHVWVAAVGAVGGILAMILVRRHQLLAASIILIASLFTMALIYVILFEDIATNLTIIIAILCVGIAIQTIPAEKIGWAIGLIVATTVSLVILDQFWPAPRSTPPPQTAAIITLTGGVTILILIITVIRQFPSFSLRGKLIGATLAVAFLSVAAVAFGVSYLTTAAITEEVGANLASTAKTQALALGENLARSITGLEALSINRMIQEAVVANNQAYTGAKPEIIEGLRQRDEEWQALPDDDPAVQAVLQNEIAAELKKYQITFPEAFELLVIDKYGGLVASTNRPDDFYEGEESWFSETYAGGFGSVYLSNPLYDSERSDWYIYVATPIHTSRESGGGEISGVIRATVRLDALASILAAGQFGETGHVEIYFPATAESLTDEMIAEQGHEEHGASDDETPIMVSITVNELGEIMYHPTDLVSEINSLAMDPTAAYIVAEHHGVESFVAASAMNTLANSPSVQLLDWTVTAFQESSESLQPVVNQQRLNTILGMFVVIIAGSVAFYVGNLITRPIAELTEVAKQVSEGDLTVQANIESRDEIGTLAIAFNGMTAQLRDSINTLEQRVADRTQALATSAEVGRQISTILDEDELITAVVNQVRDAFNYYQAQIYLLADDGKTLVMASGTGEAGRQMLVDGHHLLVGEGLVGRAAERNQVILVSDVSQDENWLPNPLLPDTKSETAVPIAIGEHVVGVLDVQDDTVNGLQVEDSDLLQSIANQVAVALRNAHLYQETQERARQETLLRSINQKILTTTDIETAMKVAIRELGQALGTPQTIIRLGHPDSQMNAQPTNGDNHPENN